MGANEYTGARLTSRMKSFIPKARPWDSDRIYSRFEASRIALPADVIADKKSLFWLSMSTEYHAEHFWRHIQDSGVSLSPEFLAFAKIWRRDEYIHYVGFRLVYSMLYGVPVEDLKAQVEGAPPDFSIIGRFFDDEFKICLLLAYDEIATTKYYASEFPLYAKFGDPIYSDWIKKVTLDEFSHFQNCMDIIRLRYRERIPEISQLMQEFITWDKSEPDYKNTFVLDHFWYPDEFIEHCAEVIKRYAYRG